ncbi:type II toxin-antitoxin system RelE/ParE family toxin [Microbacterium sp. NPDC097977]
MRPRDDAWRIRVGDYRVLYEVIDEQVLVTVVRVAHRRAVYDI